MADERDKAKAQKRGGGQQFISWEDCLSEESRLPALDRLNAGRAFDRRWAMALLERTQARLCDEFAVSGKANLFEALQPFQSGDESKPAYAAVATPLGTPVNTIKSLVHRLRHAIANCCARRSPTPWPNRTRLMRRSVTCWP